LRVGLIREGSLVERSVLSVATISEMIEERHDKRVIDRGGVGVVEQMALGDIGCLVPIVDQDVIPGHLFRRPGAGDLLVPLFASAEDRVHINYDASVSESRMDYERARGEPGRLIFIVHGHLLGNIEREHSVAASVILILGFSEWRGESTLRAEKDGLKLISP
jgi:hypothetical protein